MPNSGNFQPVNCFDLAATIAASGTTSAAVDLEGAALCGLFIPSAFTGTAITFQTAPTLTGTYVNVKDGAGNDYSKTVANSQFIPIAPSDMAGVRFLKVVSGSTEGAQRVITLATRPV